MLHMRAARTRSWSLTRLVANARGRGGSSTAPHHSPHPLEPLLQSLSPRSQRMAYKQTEQRSSSARSGCHMLCSETCTARHRGHLSSNRHLSGHFICYAAIALVRVHVVITQISRGWVMSFATPDGHRGWPTPHRQPPDHGL